MSSNSAESPENICIVCFKNVEIYSIGSCDHMVCYECSTRMRVLCRQNECPICRQDLPRVIFTCLVKPFNEIQNLSLEDKKFKISFQNKKIQDAFLKLLEHCCSICPNKPSFRTFQNLYNHMKEEHDLYYCDLCVEHLKIFSSERQCYTLKNLQQHKKKGDVDDRSHRGHPLCQFCDTRFMDNDCLYRHLRRDHLYCHFCDADGFDLYYSSYDYLREHFRTEHFLCEEGSCIDEKFTPVFRTEIDLKAHRASAHGRLLGKAAAKQARTLELQFTLKPRPRQLENAKLARIGQDASSSEGAVGGLSEQQIRTSLPNLDSSEFPSLPSGPNSTPVVFHQPKGRNNGTTTHAFGRKNAPLAITDENFPVLGVSSDALGHGTAPKSNNNQDKTASGKFSGGTSKNVPVQGSSTSQKNNFPALASDKSGTAMPTVNWASLGNKNLNGSKTSTAVTVNSPKLNGIEDFPSLHSKFNANLNLKANEPSKPNFVNIKTYKSNKAEIQNEKKNSVVNVPVKSNGCESSDMSFLLTNVKGKSKKKKSKVSNVEEKSDTAKKKQSLPDLEANDEISQRQKSSAFNESKAGTTTTAKPLPVAEDWFEELRKCKKNSNKDQSLGLNYTATDESTSSSKSNSTEFPVSKIINPDVSNTNSNNLGQKIFLKNSDKKAPPGFDNFSSSFNNNSNNNTVKKPPPGFPTDFHFSNNLTFTNDQNFSVVFDYSPPSDFEKRNQKLVVKVNKVIANETNLENFKRNSILYRQNLITATEYFDHCTKAMTEKCLQEVFPELLILLPDIIKQQELFQVYSQSSNFSKTSKVLKVCDTCQQVISTNDAKEHEISHSLQQHFPVLQANK